MASSLTFTPAHKCRYCISTFHVVNNKHFDTTTITNPASSHDIPPTSYILSFPIPIHLPTLFRGCHVSGLLLTMGWNKKKSLVVLDNIDSMPEELRGRTFSSVSGAASYITGSSRNGFVHFCVPLQMESLKTNTFIPPTCTRNNATTCHNVDSICSHSGLPMMNNSFTPSFIPLGEIINMMTISPTITMTTVEHQQQIMHEAGHGYVSVDDFIFHHQFPPISSACKRSTNRLYIEPWSLSKYIQSVPVQQSLSIVPSLKTSTNCEEIICGTPDRNVMLNQCSFKNPSSTLPKSLKRSSNQNGSLSHRDDKGGIPRRSRHPLSHLKNKPIIKNKFKSKSQSKSKFKSKSKSKYLYKYKSESNRKYICKSEFEPVPVPEPEPEPKPEHTTKLNPNSEPEFTSMSRRKSALLKPNVKHQMTNTTNDCNITIVTKERILDVSPDNTTQRGGKSFNNSTRILSRHVAHPKRNSTTHSSHPVHKLQCNVKQAISRTVPTTQLATEFIAAVCRVSKSIDSVKGHQHRLNGKREEDRVRMTRFNDRQTCASSSTTVRVDDLGISGRMKSCPNTFKHVLDQLITIYGFPVFQDHFIRANFTTLGTKLGPSSVELLSTLIYNTYNALPIGRVTQPATYDTKLGCVLHSKEGRIRIDQFRDPIKSINRELYGSPEWHDVNTSNFHCMIVKHQHLMGKTSSDDVTALMNRSYRHRSLYMDPFLIHISSIVGTPSLNKSDIQLYSCDMEWTDYQIAHGNSNAPVILPNYSSMELHTHYNSKHPFSVLLPLHLLVVNPQYVQVIGRCGISITHFK